MQGRSRASLLALLEAASVSPNASQYLPSLAVVYESLAARTRVGDKPVDPSILRSLIEAARVECPDVASLEDFLPHDPRFDVRVEWVGEMFRIVAGTLERPTSDIDTLRLLSAIIDPVLHEHTEFGLTDVVELVLRRVDTVACMLAPAWSSAIEQEFDSAAQISPEEFAAAMSLDPLEKQIARCSNPERARAVLEAHSVPAKRIRRSALSMVASFDSTIAIRHGQHRFSPLPAGLIAEALDSSAGELTATARALDPSLDDQWRRIAWNFVGAMLVGANYVIGPLRDDRHPQLHSVIRYSDTQYLAVSVAANLDLEALHKTVEDAAHCLDQVRPGSSLRTTTGIKTIPGSARLYRLLIVAQPQAVMIGGHPEQRCAAITLQDLMWIRRTIGRDEIDLWYFIRDCIEQRRVGRVFALHGIDLWESWRTQGKSLYRGARELAGMLIAPDRSLAEWQLASEQRDIELALYTLGMDRISEWPLHSLDTESKLVGDAVAGTLYRLIVCETPVAVALHARSRAEHSSELAYRLGECVAHKLECTKGLLVNRMRASGLRSLRIEFVFEGGTHDLPFRVVKLDGEVLVVGCAPNLQERLQEDSRSVETRFGVLLAEAIASGTASEEFVAAWIDAPPGIRVDVISVDPQVKETPRAIPLHESHRGAHLAELGAHLEANSVQPGSYHGNEAKRLETETIYPWLISRLHEELSAFDRVAVLGFVLTQLECTNCQRWWKIERTAYDIGSPSESEERFHESSQDLLNRSRFISLIVEEVLAQPPSGSQTPTEYEWQELLSLATLAGESSGRSEVLHRELANPALVVSGLYQVTIDEDDISASVDLESFSRDHRLAALPEPIPVGSTAETHDPDRQWAPFGVRLPAYASVDRSLQESLDFGIDAILDILDVIIRWPVSTPQCTDLVPTQQIAAEAHTTNPEIPLADYEAAVEWLSLGTEDFATPDSTVKHWEVERRAARVAIRPLVREESSVWLLPWTAVLARRAWFTYLSQYRMPIPDDDLPPPVADSLNVARQTQNRKFEDDCVARLTDLPLLSIPRVLERHAHRHGITHLSGEIDLLCIDAERSLIFVIEAKDPFVPLSARSIRRQITKFHKAGGDVEKLQRKVDDIQTSAASLAANKGIQWPDRDWQVVGIMVTRHVSPAAYLKACPTTFCTIDTLRETLKVVESQPRHTRADRSRPPPAQTDRRHPARQSHGGAN